MTAAWIVEALVASTLLMAAVLLLRAPVRRWFGPQVAYALWALPALRLVTPPVPAGWRETAATPIAQVGETITVLVVAEAAPTVSPGLSVGFLLLAVWAAGAMAFLLWHVVRHRRFCRRLLASAERLDEREGIAVIATDAATGPLAFGIRRRYVAFPRDFAERYDTHERSLALEHELGHHRRGDLAANWAALVVLALHWCNPLAWRAFRAFRADQELANDACVLAGRSRADAHVYACAIVKAAHGGAVSAACHLHTIEDLKGRLRMLTTSRHSRRRLAGGVATVSLLGMIGLGLTVSGSEAAAAITQTVSDKVATAQVAPVPPAPPAAVATSVPPAAAEKPRTVKRLVIVKDGKTTTYEGAAADEYARANDLPVPPVPPATPEVLVAPGRDPVHVFLRSKGQGFTMAAPPSISERACLQGEGNPGQVTYTTEKDGKKFVIVCRNRLDDQAAHARARARVMWSDGPALERDSIASARLSLRAARSAIVGNRDMTDDQRRQALAGIDQAMAELAAKPD